MFLERFSDFFGWGAVDILSGNVLLGLATDPCALGSKRIREGDIPLA